MRGWFLRVLVPQRETWVAVTGNSVAGVMVLNDGELKQLYLDPAWRGRGLGGRFMTLAKQHCPDGLTLWTLQVNEAAQRFDLRHGFEEAERTGGQRNDEREPDIRYIWQPAAAAPGETGGQAPGSGPPPATRKRH